MKSYNDIDMQHNEVKNVILDKQTNTTSVTSPMKGQICFIDTSGKYYFYTGTKWSPMGGISTQTTTLTCTLPDLT